MSPKQFRQILERHNITQMDLSRAFGMSPRAIRRWALDERGISPLVAKVMHLIDKRKVTIRDIKDAA